MANPCTCAETRETDSSASPASPGPGRRRSRTSAAPSVPSDLAPCAERRSPLCETPPSAFRSSRLSRDNVRAVPEQASGLPSVPSSAGPHLRSRPAFPTPGSQRPSLSVGRTDGRLSKLRCAHVTTYTCNLCNMYHDLTRPYISARSDVPRWRPLDSPPRAAAASTARSASWRAYFGPPRLHTHGSAVASVSCLSLDLRSSYCVGRHSLARRPLRCAFRANFLASQTSKWRSRVRCFFPELFHLGSFTGMANVPRQPFLESATDARREFLES